MPPDAADKLSRFLLRQPLLDERYRTVGYEFSLRDRALLEVLPGAVDLEQSRDEHLIASVVDLEFQQVLGDRLILLNLSAATFNNPLMAAMPRGKVGVMLHLDLPDLTDKAKALDGLGLLPVLDDDGAPQPRLLPPGCEVARLNSESLDANVLGNRVARLRRHGIKRLIAANVDSEEALDACRQLGFDLFQGEFLTRPRAVPARKLDSNVAQVMELLNLAHEKAPVESMEAIFKRDAALTYRLLRFINSPANGLRATVKSIGHALVWLGYGPLYRWLSLLLFSTGNTDGRSSALLNNALIRARFMENLGGPKLDAELRGGLFIVGILSHLDALLNQPMAQALDSLRLPDAMRDALIDGSGPYAPWLKFARACERFDHDTVTALAAAQKLNSDEVNQAHMNALIWSESLEK
jgi:EAL and modified HD-GYP domain-containing signal transduction protein